MSEAILIYPHQLFENYLKPKTNSTYFLIEEPLYFKQYKFNKKKLILHRSTMKFYESFLKSKDEKVIYINTSKLAKTTDIANILSKKKIKKISFNNLFDNWLKLRLEKSLDKYSIKYSEHESDYLMNNSNNLVQDLGDKIFFTSFYIKQRKKFQILVDNNKPLKSKWTFDAENRKKLPKNYESLECQREYQCSHVKEAIEYVNINFSSNYGNTDNYIYGSSFEHAKNDLKLFLTNKLTNFGQYQDAISSKYDYLNHSLISMYINVGLLTPKYVAKEALKYIDKVPYNSLEGFIRQLIGWREFMMAVYLSKGSEIRNSNFFNHKNNLNNKFYNASTGILPLDICIEKAVNNSYLHHIERLMVVGNIMLLLKIEPNDIYKWFMELFIDAYDWVMIANVYSMSQYSDGGLITTKPYIASSNYIKKMSDYKKGDWEKQLTALYWSFVNINTDKLKDNARMKFTYMGLNKMSNEKLTQHDKIAKKLIKQIFNY